MARYILEYSEFYIVKEAQTKNCTHQTNRWKQLAMSDDREALERLIPERNSKNYRIETRTE